MRGIGWGRKRERDREAERERVKELAHMIWGLASLKTVEKNDRLETKAELMLQS